MDPKTTKGRVLLATTCASLLAGLTGLAPAGARPINVMSYGELTDKADLIVISTVKSNKDQPEDRTRLLRLNVMGVDTTFSTDAVLKAKNSVQPDIHREGQTFVLHHYREAYPKQVSINGPDLIQFEPKPDTKYLMFLTRREDGRFEPVTGQIDPGFSMERIGSPGLWQYEAEGALDEATVGDRGPAGAAHSQSSASASGPNGNISISSSSNHGGNVTSIVGPVKRVDAAAGILVLSGVEAVVGKDAQGNTNVRSVKKDFTFSIQPGTVFTHLKGLQDIHVGDTVGATGEKQADGSVRATEVSK